MDLPAVTLQERRSILSHIHRRDHVPLPPPPTSPRSAGFVRPLSAPPGARTPRPPSPRTPARDFSMTLRAPEDRNAILDRRLGELSPDERANLEIDLSPREYV